MHARPSRLALATAAQAILLAFLANPGEPVRIALEDIALHEGERVLVAGVAERVHPAGERTRIALRAGTHGLEAWIDGAVHVPEGAWIEAEGRLTRIAGALALSVPGPHAVQATVPPGLARPSWPDLAAAPWHWEGQAIELSGRVERGHLRDGNGHSLRLGEGAWPREGAVTFAGAIAYEPDCLCFTARASRVDPVPWTL